MDDNRACSLCKLHPADQFCICSDLPLLCPACLQLHVTKPDFHFTLPTSDYYLVQSYGQIETKIWLMSLKHSQEKLMENVSLVEKFMADLVNLQIKIVEKVTELTNNSLETLASFREILHTEIKKAVKETSANACRAEYAPQNYLASLIWNHCLRQCTDPISVLEWEVKTEGMQKEWMRVELRNSVPHLEHFNFTSHLSPISNSPEEFSRSQGKIPISDSRLISEPIKPLFQLISVEPRQVKVCDIPEMRSHTAPLSNPVPRIDQYSRFIWVEKGVYCSGGGAPYTKEAYLLGEGREWTVTKLRDMRTGRCSHGQWWDSERREVLTFGGTG